MENPRWRPRSRGVGAFGMVPFGIVGGRLYHVATDPELYFTAGKNPWNAFKIWVRGLGIRGAVLLGGVGSPMGAAAGSTMALDKLLAHVESHNSR